MGKMTEKLPDLMEKVRFCRIQPADPAQGQPEDALIWGEGFVVGLIIGVNQRANVMVKDSETSRNKAYTLEPMCINATEEAGQRYLAHRQRLAEKVRECDSLQKKIIEDGNAACDAMNTEIFGPPVEF